MVFFIKFLWQKACENQDNRGFFLILYYIERAAILVAERLTSYISVIWYIIVWILGIYIKNRQIFHRAFHKTLVKTKHKEAFFLFWAYIARVVILIAEGLRSKNLIK